MLKKMIIIAFLLALSSNAFAKTGQDDGMATGHRNDTTFVKNSNGIFKQKRG